MLQPRPSNEMLVLNKKGTSEKIKWKLTELFPGVILNYISHTPYERYLRGDKPQLPFTIKLQKYNPTLDEWLDLKLAKCELIIKALDKRRQDFGEHDFFAVTVAHLTKDVTDWNNHRLQIYDPKTGRTIDFDHPPLEYFGYSNLSDNDPQFFVDILLLKLSRSQMLSTCWLNEEDSLSQYRAPSRFQFLNNSLTINGQDIQVLGILDIDYPEQVETLRTQDVALFVNDSVAKLEPPDSEQMGPQGPQTFTLTTQDREYGFQLLIFLAQSHPKQHYYFVL